MKSRSRDGLAAKDLSRGSNTLSSLQFCKKRYFPGIATKKIKQKQTNYDITYKSENAVTDKMK